MKRLLWAFLNLLVRLWNKIDQHLCRSLPYLLRYGWQQLWVRKGEFHPSLDSDYEGLKPDQREAYSLDLVRRRQIAHERELGEGV